MDSGYSAVANQQLDEIEANDPALYDDVIRVCEDILEHPGAVRPMSAAIRTDQGLRLVTAVPGRFPIKVFWSTEAPRIEAV